MTTVKLSVNVNKYALLRNSRGRDVPNLLDAVDTVLAAGAQGVTIHPRRDQRHIRYTDILPVSKHLSAQHPGIEFNIECENHPEIVDQVVEIRPHQCTLVPVRPGEVTSDHGYRFPEDHSALRPTVERLQAAGVRVSIFMDCDADAMRGAADAGVDRVELYTGPFAWAWGTENQGLETERMWDAARAATELGMGVNAGHDLDRHNLVGLRGMSGLLEVSIGHAQIARALEVGTTQSVKELLAAL